MGEKVRRIGCVYLCQLTDLGLGDFRDHDTLLNSDWKKINKTNSKWPLFFSGGRR